MLARRAALRAAYAKADAAGAGMLPVAEWAELTQAELGITVPLMQLRGQLLGAGAARSSSTTVDYGAYLARHQLVHQPVEHGHLGRAAARHHGLLTG